MDLDIHQANFDVDERAIGVGVRLLAASALIALAGQSAEEAVASARGAA
jgi:amidohydrolase